ncbi:DUF2256 domain-containing protein [Kaistella montana]
MSGKQFLWLPFNLLKKKSDLPMKFCADCNRTFSWRKKWQKVWK